MTIYPGLDQGGYGGEILQAHAQHWFGGDQRNGLIVTLIDVWVLPPEVIRNLNVASWVPVDHDPVPDQVEQWFGHSGAIPIAMSRFGAKQLERHDPLYVPHGINTKILKPMGRSLGRKSMGITEDAFLVGMVAANKGNPSRKNFPQAIAAFAEFRKKHTDAVLYLHTEGTGRAQGINLHRLLAEFDLPREAVVWADQYMLQCLPVPLGAMAHMYSALDVLLAPSAGEGFGVPLLEAQSCGVPVITTDFSACPEVGKNGWHVGGTKTWTHQDSWQFNPDHDQLVNALNQAYDLAGSQADDCRAHALEYDTEQVLVEYMLPALAECERRIAEREPKVLSA